ncbi:serine hydrolase [candidate division KSB1 bacterium]|nr:serine hydrolase [candidate division KSB1 bacterium]NIR68766.1 serine hydrolase [candidate division KSB1 bacterium]NIS25582.1 serine hydrolase [candidate division KSB1 bacterium]NIT72476.1 serine hydrolase [candidate division KSB1 bacterium]NIU26260.1 serine hydrolase [candidate division KSB1 bacterium]
MVACTKYAILLSFGLVFPSFPAFSQQLVAVLDKFDSTVNYRKLNKKDLQSFSDAFFENRMEELHIPGAVILLVKDGRILFQKGYGYADIEHKVPVSPEKTLLRVGSITKLFTSTAMMQLIEKGQVNLNENVNNYLKLFKIDNPYPNPVTVKSLLTHTAGFDHQHIGRYVRPRTEVRPLGQVLKDNLPRLVFNPGEFINYSNVGLSLVGFLVEEITNVHFTEYIKDNILQPLEMHSTGFAHEIEPNRDLAIGYKYAGHNYRAFPAEYLNLVPAGALISTAADMAKFMIMHLQDGRYQNIRILEGETVREMHRRQFDLHPRMWGWCYGFYEGFDNSIRAIMHSGNTRGFSSLLYLLKEQNLGIFIAYNANDASLYDEYIDRFHRRYFPVSNEIKPDEPLLVDKNHVRRFTGIYQFNSAPKLSISKLTKLLENPSEVVIDSNEDGTLNVHLPERILKMFEIEPLLFRSLSDETRMAFEEDDEGNITHMFLNRDKPVTLEKLAWWQTFRFQINFMRAFVFVFAISLFCLIPYYLTSQRPAKGLIFLAGLICFLNVVFLVGLIALYDTGELRFGISTGLMALLIIPKITTILWCGLLLLTIMAWRKESGTLIQRLHFSFVTVTLLAFVPFLYYWNCY